VGAFLVSDAGYFTVVAVEDGQSQVLVESKHSASIRSGEMNRLTAMAEGSHYLFLVNDEVVAELEYGGLGSGASAVAMMLLGSGRSAVFEFDNFELRAP
jgi:hypothetical protein